jgi:phage replication O-like protein O
MANPQLDNGYVRIATEIMEAFARIRIPGEARQVLDVILRKTYGFQKKEDKISLSQFCLATGLTKPHVCHSLAKLRIMNLIAEKGNGGTTTYSFNKDFDAWKALPKKATLPKKEMNVAEKGKNHCRKRVPQKIKDTLTKDIGTDLLQEFEKEFWQPYPLRNGKKIGRQTSFQSFKKHIKPDERPLVYRAVKNYAGSGEMPKDPVRFIKCREYPNGLWREWIEQGTAAQTSHIPEGDNVLKKIQEAKKQQAAEGENG